MDDNGGRGGVFIPRTSAWFRGSGYSISLPEPLLCPPSNSHSIHDMSSLPTHSAATLMHGPLMTIWHFLAVSVSLDESCMLMEVLISMLSAISPESFDPEDPMSLMLQATTLTLRHLEEGRNAVTTMRSKMEMWSPEDSLGRAEEEFTKMCLRGALSSVKKVRASFGNVLHDWIHVRCAPITTASEHMRTGSTDPLLFSTNIPPGSNLSSEWYLSWLSGERSLLELIGNAVSLPTSLRGWSIILSGFVLAGALPVARVARSGPLADAQTMVTAKGDRVPGECYAESLAYVSRKS